VVNGDAIVRASADVQGLAQSEAADTVVTTWGKFGGECLVVECVWPGTVLPGLTIDEDLEPVTPLTVRGDKKPDSKPGFCKMAPVVGWALGVEVEGSGGLLGNDERKLGFRLLRKRESDFKTRGSD